MADNSSLPGVSIVIKGTSIGTVSDATGSYVLEASPNDLLIFSFIGMETKEVAINGKTIIDIIMNEDVQTLSEVVVVGYGTIKKTHLTGAVAQVGGADVAAIQASRVDDALAGKLSGVMIQNQSGEPGADPKIQIRAASSVSGASNPLIVVDGYPISGNLATVNPNDIESLEVLKDAASAAIYGSRGANGVILVTTKKGKAGNAKISYNGYTSFSNKYVKDLDQLKTAGEWADELETGIANGSYDLSEIDPRLVDYRINAYKNAPDVLSVEDWLFRTGKSTSHDISMSGGSKDVSVYGSLGYLKTDGVVITQGFERYNGRLNVDANLGKKLKAGLSINGSVGKRDIVGWDMRDLLRAYSISPIYHTDASIAFVQQLDAERAQLSAAGVPGLTRTFDQGYRGGSAPFNNSINTLKPGMTAQDWHYGREGNGIGGTGDAGPATKLDNTELWQKTYFTNFSSYLQYSIIEGLNVKTLLGGEIYDTEDYYYRGLESDAAARGTETNLDQTETKKSSWLSETTLNYGKVIGKHDVSAVAGIEFQNLYTKGTSVNAINVPFGDIQNYNLILPANITVTETDETISRRSIFGRIHYAYDNRYMLSASLRRDGDSRFGENNRYQSFPSLSVGWNVHNESFFNSNLISNLKLRLSTGSLGTTSFLGAYSSLSLLNPRVTGLGSGYVIPTTVANPDLTWQSTTSNNYGVNLGILHNRFTLGVDYYTSDVKDMLIKQSVSEVVGVPSVILNRGDVRSSGLEFELSTVLMEKKGVTWNVSANLSTVKTEITSLGELDELPRVIYGQSGRGPYFRNYVGGQIGEMWALQTIGAVETQYMVDPTRAIGITSSEYYVKDQQLPGEPGYGVIDGTKTVDEGGDLIKVGQNTPDFYWGLNTSVSYKGFDLSLQLQGAEGGEVFNIDPIYYGSEFGGRLRTSFDANSDGFADHNGVPFKTSQFQLDAQIQDASYLAFRNVTIGYTIKPDWANKAGISSARIYAAATNLFYLMGSNYTSFNPEGIETTNPGYAGPTTYGVQVGASPIVRSFTLGVNLNF
jgi:TonB-linked SusC/RagA family outer membrane protein